MKAIFVCDNNPAYSGFWKHQAKYMWNRYKIRSLLYYLSDSDTHTMFTSDFAEVRPIRLASSTPRIVQALYAKWYFPCYENTTEKLFIGDIDCFVLSQKLLDTASSEENLFHLKNLQNGSIPGYYVAGSVPQLREFFRVDEYANFEAFCIAMMKQTLRDQETNPVNGNTFSHFSKSASPDWHFFGSEEMYAGRCGAVYTKPVNKSMECPNYRNRICRSTNSVFDEKKLRNGEYIDYHCPRPYEAYEATICNILDKTLS